jgi:hypothetical protein
MIKKIFVVAEFEGQPNDTTDQRCRAIFEQYEGEFIGCGTFGGADPPFRWGIEHKVSEGKVVGCITELRNIGMIVYMNRFEQGVMRSRKSKYLIMNRGTKRKAHIWNYWAGAGNPDAVRGDTLCLMLWRRPEVDIAHYSLHEERGSHEICQKCLYRFYQFLDLWMASIEGKLPFSPKPDEITDTTSVRELMAVQPRDFDKISAEVQSILETLGLTSG